MILIVDGEGELKSTGGKDGVGGTEEFSMSGTLICFECFCHNSDYVPLAGDNLHIPTEILHQF